MAEDTDFALLYRELGIDANCALPDLRNAYRRRVAKLHPDQGGDNHDVQRLQHLNRLYAEATDFHRRHGRLPGAIGAHVPLSQSVFDHLRTAPSALASGERAAQSADFERISRYFIIVAVIGMAALAWRALDSGSNADDSRATGTGMESVAPIAPKHIRAGMGKADVLLLSGSPDTMHDLRWEYGPSWIEFRCGEVVDWYSSPEQPLKTEKTHGLQNGHAPPDDQRCL